jgi:predicted  nucleic acid-binding Zn-ribbon protein
MPEMRELEKRIEWLDSERQKDKKTITELLDELASLKEELQKQNIHFQTLEKTVKNNASLPSRIDQIDQQTAVNHTDLLKKLQEIDKKIVIVDKRVDKVGKEEFEQINKQFQVVEIELKPIKELKKNVNSRVEEEFRIGQKIEEVANFIPELRNSDLDLQRQITVLSGDRPQESKRITDLQLETSALRKRLEEIRNMNEQDKETIRKMERKLDDLISTEKDRRQTQIAFMEKISLSQVDKDSQWKEWQEKYTELQSIGPALSTQLLAFEEAHRSLKKTQSEFDDINERLNRRINEITEMNRLAEERFRQEWVTFKADDQKRWTNYTLARDEETREDDRLLSQVTTRLVTLEDSIQDLKDSVGLITEETKKQLNGFYATAQELVESFNQSFRKRL